MSGARRLQRGRRHRSRRPPPSLHRRVVWAFAGFGFVLSVCFALLVEGGMFMAEDRMVARYLEIELEDYLHLLDTPDPGGAIPQPSARWLKADLGGAGLPPDLARRAAELGEGVHEVTTEAQGEDGVHLLIRTLPSGERLYLWAVADEIEVLDTSLIPIGGILFGTVVLVTLLGAGLGRMTARKVIAPVVELADRVRRLDIDDPDRPLDRPLGRPLDHPLDHGLAADEVGLLARTLDASFARSRAFLERERRFTRDASHELRSPVTVVRGAVELIEANEAARQPAIARPLARIRRAAETMSSLIEAFLWLAREEALSEAGRPRSLEAEVGSIVEQHRHLLAAKEVELEVGIEPGAEILAPDGILGIVLGNLVANAFFHVREGKVEIRGDARSFEVIDTGPGIPRQRLEAVLEPHEKGGGSAGFGLGLAICRDLCERFGWRLELESSEGAPGPGGTRCPRGPECPRGGTRARVEFAP